LQLLSINYLVKQQWRAKVAGKLCKGLYVLTIFVTTSIIKFVDKKNASGSKQHKVGALEEQASLAMMKAADKLQGRVAEMLKEYGLSPTQYNALRILRGAGPEGLTCSQIGERMINRDPDITRLLARLEGRRLVIRRRERKDRRVVMTSITPAGLDLLRSIDEPIMDFHHHLLGHMGEARLKSLIRLLNAARKAAA
jgi:DNA-binding MarR family transcriptional regulator